MNSTNQPIYSDKPSAKSIFASKTLWGAVLAGIASLVPLAVKDIKAHEITVEDAGQAILILCGVGTAIVGRVNAQAPIYTPDALPGPNKSDFGK
ncbi:hypothetical protein N0Y54_37065 [Nostoc punctiforme UO1]|uniref:hypothetical protein n=1 Tax=Nostoc punctiforme TaxID=272131 RepID=UPI0030B14DC0